VQADAARRLSPGTEKACFAVTETEYRPQHHAAENPSRYTVRQQNTSSMAKKSGSPPRRSPRKILLLARTTPLEEVKSPTQGLSLFYTDFDRRSHRRS